jgi:hypothetical protein
MICLSREQETQRNMKRRWCLSGLEGRAGLTGWTRKAGLFKVAASMYKDPEDWKQKEALGGQEGLDKTGE